MGGTAVAEDVQTLPVITDEADLLEYFATHQHLRVEIFRAGRFILSQQRPRSWRATTIAAIDPDLADRIVGGMTRLTEDPRTGLWFALPSTADCDHEIHRRSLRPGQGPLHE